LQALVPFIKHLFTQNNIGFQYLNEGFDIIETETFDIWYFPVGFKIENYPQKTSEKLCLNIWEDQWISKPEIVMSRIKAQLGLLFSLPARVCKIMRIDKPQSDAFLAENHLQGVVSAKFKYGLFLPQNYFRLLPQGFTLPVSDLLVGVLTVSQARKIYVGDTFKNSYEIVRFASLRDFQVKGAFSKLLKFFMLDKSPENLMTYVDKDWSTGANFYKMGFELKETLPQIFFDLNESGKRVKVEKNEGYRVFNTGSFKFVKDV
jgi:hypothetical protein